MKKKTTSTNLFFVSLLCVISIFLQGLMINHAKAEETWKPAPGLISIDGRQPVQSQVIEENNEIIRVQYSVPEPIFEISEDQKKDGENTERCILGNANLVGKPGEPLIPAVTSRIILPQGRAVKAIRIIPGEIVEIPESHLLAFGEIPHRLSSENVERINASDETYDSNNPFPLELYELISVQDRCGVSIAIIENYPLIYYPASGRIEYYKSFTLEVETEPAEQKTESSTIKPRPDRILKGIQTEENPATLESYNNAGKYDEIESLEEYSYVVVTNNAIINATTSPNLTDFIAHKTRLGFTCRVESIGDIKSNYPGSGDDDKLRNFLRYAYNNWNTQYVLLGGDTNIIPLRTVYATYGSEGDYLPSDLPYQCLSQETWNNDYEAELFIGRASAENADEFSNFVYKTVTYETSNPSAPYLKKVLSASEKLDNSTYGKESMDTIANLFSSDFSFNGIHDQNGTWPGASTIINSVNSNKYGIINHLGHSNTTYVMKLSSGGNWNPDSFTNTNFIFAKSQGCIPGAFDRDCIAEHMTTSNRAGMWGVVYNSRYGWYQPGNPTGGSSHKVHASFWSAYFDHDLKTVGQSNEYSHRLNTTYRWDILESNLLGDPSVVVGETTPSTGPVASFDSEYDPGNEYKVIFTDNSSCSDCQIVEWAWDFGDSSTSDSENPEHIYTSDGTYTVELTVTSGQNETATFSKAVTVPQVIDYCESKSTDSTYFHISNVAVGSFSNSSGASNYTDFTSETITMKKDELYNFEIACGGETQYHNWYTIRVDLNRDGDFEDSGEAIYDSGDAITGGASGSITIPASAITGSTRMRVTQKNGSQSGPCEVFTYGEVEDYTVSILDHSDPLEASFTSDINDLTVAFTNTSTGDIAGYYWDFGDRETSDEENPVHTYEDAGTYTVNLTVTGEDGSQDTETAQVTVTGGSGPVTASFTSDINDLTVSFTDTSTGDIASYYWDFGDRDTSDEENPVHMYSDAGTYTVTLNITGKDGSQDTEAAQVTVTGESDPVTASFTSDINSLTVAFTDTSTGDIASHYWDFGDRETSDEQNPEHTYKDAGTYNLSLTVTGKDGSQDTANASITVIDDNIEYCESKSTDINYFWINNVSVGTFSKPSDAQYYSDFTSDTVSVSKGKAYDLSIGCGGETKYHNWYTVRVDLNRDGDFEDSGEILYDSGDAITGGASGSITIPDSAITGNTRMRVTQKNGSQSDPCEVFTWGEVEDYTLKIGAGDPNEVEAFFTHTTDNLNVEFTDKSSGTISNWAWNFGDNETSEDQNPRHTYSKSGSYQVTLTVTNNNGNTDSYTSSIPVSGGNDNNEFIVTAVNDNLDNNDMYLMSNGLKSLGYTEDISDTNVSSSELRQYLSKDIKALYHTGHGSEGAIMTSDGSVTSSGTALNVENTMIATCLTLTDTSWKSCFSSRAQMFAGYTKVSFDGPDDDVVNNIIGHLGNNTSYPVSWYLSNNSVSSLSDRWCLYSREGSNIVEYSARTGNIPSNYQVDEMSNLGKDNKLFVLNSLLDRYNSVKLFYPEYSVDNIELKTSENLNRFKVLNETKLLKKDILVITKDYLRNRGELSEDMKLDKITVIQKKISDNDKYKEVGYSVRYIKKAPNGMDIRGNGNEMHKTVMITGKGKVVSFSKNWMTLSKILDADAEMPQLLSITDALNIAAADISRGIKSEKLELVDVEMVYGISPNRSGSMTELVPSYGFISSDGITIVVNAQTGDLIQ